MKSANKTVGAATFQNFTRSDDLEKLMAVENAEAASRNHRENIPTAETDVDVGRIPGVSNQPGLIAVWINRIFRQHDRAVIVTRAIWKRERDDFPCTNESPCQAAIKAMNEAGRVSSFGLAKHT